MTPGTDDIVVAIWAVLLALALTAYIAREVYRAKRGKDRPVPIRTDLGLLKLMATTGPLFVEEMTRFGVTRAKSRVARLLAIKHLSAEEMPGGTIYQLTEWGHRRLRAEVAKYEKGASQ